MRLRTGDIATLWGAGIRRLVVDTRDEIVPLAESWSNGSGLRLRTVYRLAGSEYSNAWFTENQLSVAIPRI